MTLRTSMILTDATAENNQIEIVPMGDQTLGYIRIKDHQDVDNMTYDISKSAIPELIQRLQAYVDRGSFVLPSDVE